MHLCFSKLEQLERLRSEIPPYAPWLPKLVIHIRSQFKTNFETFQETLHVTHHLKMLDKMYKYVKDPTRTVVPIERTRDVGRTDRQTDWVMHICFSKLEQLERLRSEIPPYAPWLPILVIHIRSQFKTNFETFQETLHVTHHLKMLDKMYKYEKDPTRTVVATERTRDVGRTDRQTDRRTDGLKPIYPPTT